MANAIYPKYKEALLGGGANTDMLTGDVKAILVDLADYTYSAAHQFLSDVPAAARVATSGNLATKTVTDGTFDSADFTWTAATGDPSEAIILYIDTGVEGTSRLILFLDTGQTGLPVTPNGGDINFTVDAAGWFTL
ncbi:hypothetical protein DDZ14_08565 [Maritimibacter sp. 55A14]|uniref:hypothetical protein n=1 Tax=Maritimibacter sp. 55A14 TaxID=2174844 RepID=UPI000D618F2C|nr:hypothetical protein [Maritimibacter sp. 55A14]PWE32789.1 hypothetical protein DDZ14_08565 [Maritimibacter sp. 55A14]